MNELLVLSKDTDFVQKYGQNLLSESDVQSKRTLNNTQLSVFGGTSDSICDLLEYIDHYNTKEKKWLDNLPFVGNALKSNRFKSYTIDKVVDLFSQEILTASKNIGDCLEYSRKTRKEINEVKEKVELQLEDLTKVLDATVSTDYSRYNLLEQSYKNSSISDDDYDELCLIKNNLETLNGTKKALELAIKSLDMKKQMFSTIIDAGIRIQGKAKQCQVLPAIIRTSLDIIRVSNNLSSAASSLDSTEKIVKTLVSGASSSVNSLSDKTNQIKDISIDFNQILSSIREVKTDCDSILNGGVSH
jgi:translation initiation factor 2B subunit (eIF-2B alpha/beta/delta family)